MITEFGLSAPGLPKHLKSEFAYQTRSLTSLYQRAFGKGLKIGKAWKFLVEVVPEVERSGCRDLLGVITTQIAADAETLLMAADVEKPRIALEWLMRGLSGAAQALNIDAKRFHMAAEKVQVENYVNAYMFKKPVPSRNGKRVAKLFVKHGIHEAEIIGRISTQDGTLIREQVLFTTRPDELIFVPMLGKLEWHGDSEVVLQSTEGNEVARISATPN